MVKEFLKQKLYYNKEAHKGNYNFLEGLTQQSVNIIFISFKQILYATTFMMQNIMFLQNWIFTMIVKS